MDIKTRLTRCCGKPVGGYKCGDGIRCPDCFDKLQGWREIELLREILKNHGISEKGEYHASASMVEASAGLEESVLETGKKGT